MKQIPTFEKQIEEGLFLLPFNDLKDYMILVADESGNQLIDSSFQP